jgi:hypothetical protein
VQRKGLERALDAKRESRRVAFRETFDPSTDQAGAEVVRDIVAMANSGGGAIVVDGRNADLDPGAIAERVYEFTGSHFSDFELVESARDSRPVVVILVEESPTPIVFSKASALFDRGQVFFRHGSRSAPGTTEDVAAAMARRTTALQKSWLRALRRVILEADRPASLLPPEIRDSDSPEATPIRVVEDPNAPAYRLIDYDKTHPYRQKELLAAFRQRVPERPINQFDLLAVRHTHKIADHPEFAHKPMFGSRQYSERFLNWLVEQATSDPQFFEKARVFYRAHTAGAAES